MQKVTLNGLPYDKKDKFSSYYKSSDTIPERYKEDEEEEQQEQEYEKEKEKEKDNQDLIIKDLQEQCNHLIERNIKLEEKLNNTFGQIEQNQRIIYEKDQQILKMSESTIYKQNEEYEFQQEKIKVLILENQKYDQQMDCQRHDIIQLKSALEQFENVNDQLKKSFQQCQNELEKSSQHFKERVQLLLKQIEVLQKVIGEKNEELDNVEKENEKLKKEIDKWRMRLSSVEGNYEIQQGEYINKIEIMEQESNFKDQKMKNVQKEKDLLYNKYTEVLEKYNESYHNLKLLEQEYQTYKQQQTQVHQQYQQQLNEEKIKQNQLLEQLEQERQNNIQLQQEEQQYAQQQLECIKQAKQSMFSGVKSNNNFGVCEEEIRQKYEKMMREQAMEFKQTIKIMQQQHEIEKRDVLQQSQVKQKQYYLLREDHQKLANEYYKSNKDKNQENNKEINKENSRQQSIKKNEYLNDQILRRCREIAGMHF